MNLPWTNTHIQMFTLSSIATTAKLLGPTKISVVALSQLHTVHFKLIRSLSLHSYLTEGLGKLIRFYDCCSHEKQITK